jgi:hypothetical protein
MSLHYNSSPFPGVSNTLAATTTTDDYVIVLPMSCLGYSQKNIIIKNTHVSASLTFKLDGFISRDDVAAASYPIMPDTALVAGDIYTIEITKPYDLINLSVKSTVSSTPSTCTISHVMQRSGT